MVLRRSAGWARGPAPPRDSDAFRRSRSACARVQGWDAFLARITEALAVRPASGGRWSPRRTLAREPDQAPRLSFAEACGGAVPGRGGAGYRGRCACTAAAMGIASGAQAARRLHRASLALALRCGSDLPTRDAAFSLGRPMAVPAGVAMGCRWQGPLRGGPPHPLSSQRRAAMGWSLSGAPSARNRDDHLDADAPHPALGVVLAAPTYLCQPRGQILGEGEARHRRCGARRTRRATAVRDGAKEGGGPDERDRCCL